MMTQPAGEISAERLRLYDLTARAAGDSLAEDARRGLSVQPKYLQPKYFYDELGSHLFDAICHLPEYYPTRAEHEILARAADEIADAVGEKPVTLLELGSGSAVKTRYLIAALLRRQETLRYIPVDISAAALETGARALLQSYPALSIEAYASDYDTALARLQSEKQAESASRSDERGRILALFLGSNIGNFDRDEAEAFLRALRGVLRAGDALLLGADLKKERAVLEAAYNDALGVTAAFNLNLLVRLNRELDADFDVKAFRHVALYNEEAGRIEMHLESLRAQTVRLRRIGLEIPFAAGERIHTENSYKYDRAQLAQMAARTGFALTREWRDQAGRFSSNLFLAVAEEQE